ncbi:MAG: hypothetical protein LBP59_05275 [Planctomycetaceae bacterium]|nr:hypothetical protein [Planctomycetaceae bacterium]
MLRKILYLNYSHLSLHLPSPASFRTAGFDAFKLFALEFSFTFACLVFGRQAWTLLNRR